MHTLTHTFARKPHQSIKYLRWRWFSETVLFEMVTKPDKRWLNESLFGLLCGNLHELHADFVLISILKILKLTGFNHPIGIAVFCHKINENAFACVAIVSHVCLHLHSFFCSKMQSMWCVRGKLFRFDVIFSSVSFLHSTWSKNVNSFLTNEWNSLFLLEIVPR